MVWLFMLAAAGVFGVFLIQASGFDIDTALNPQPAAPVATPKQASEQERFAVQGSEFAGFDDDQQPYNIAAEQANQDKQQPNLVHLRQVTGLLKRSDGRAMDVTAKNRAVQQQGQIPAPVRRCCHQAGRHLHCQYGHCRR